jgi:4,5-DOPA dioxygenase extradiol
VLVVSPHWMTPSPRVGLSSKPQTIHDFGGFDPALYEIVYPVDGHPELAQRALDLLGDAGFAPQPDERRGLDHGAWVPLRHLYPAADVPAFQVSLPSGLDSDGAWAFGAALAPLAQAGVLILGSGSLTHNLAEFRLSSGTPQSYAAEFAAWVRDAVIRGDSARLRQTLTQAPHARRAHPTTEHLLPLLVAAGAAAAALPIQVIEGGIAHGVLSMDSFLFGASEPFSNDAA